MEFSQEAAAAQLALLLQVAKDAQTTNYMAVAALTILVMDYLLTIDKEVELIWKRPKRIAAYLFLINRYFSLLAISAHVSFMLREVPTDDECVALFYLELASSIVITPVVDLVLFLRVWALYSKSKMLLYCLLPVILVEPIIMIVLCSNVISLIKKNGFLHVGPIVQGCYPLGNFPRTSYSAMIYTPMAISIVLFILTMYKCGFRFYKDKFGTSRHVGTPLLSLFMRDGIYWFVPVLGLFISQIVIVSEMRMTLGEILINPCMVGYSVITSRILLNMKEISVEKTTNTSISEDTQRGGPILLEDMHSTPSKRVSLGRITIEVPRSVS